MAMKNTAEVVIAGKVYKISGYESPEYLHQIAVYLNDKMSELQKAEGYFYSSDKENGHYGIGLSVSRVLCEKLNGTISIYNDKNGGACVRLRLKNSEYSH